VLKFVALVLALALWLYYGAAVLSGKSLPLEGALEVSAVTVWAAYMWDVLA